MIDIYLAMNKSFFFSSALLISCACSSQAQVIIYNPNQTPPPPVSTRDRGLIAFDIKKLENQVQELERAIRYERSSSAPSHAVINAYEQQIIVLRQQIVNLNIEYANARP